MPDVTNDDRTGPHFKSDKPINPGDLVGPVWSEGGASESVTLWKDQGGSAIVGRLSWLGIGLVIAREVDCDKDLGDQCLVLTEDMQLGWNTTHSFEKIQDRKP